MNPAVKSLGQYNPEVVPIPKVPKVYHNSTVRAGIVNWTNVSMGHDE